ncbi:hypothetical protein GGR42_000833 [Saonia flava]|uniref:DUF4136 domain-containing protein n=1 Tax=Saonia flava TaxID=523696 RepID=A0A846QQH7_9FLAO|nr:hypothetical protein [Saonia flava]NJB70371.1 hypothetical protein [Saonia flava]
MKKIVWFTVILFMMSCSSTRFVESWKNPEIRTFNPNKLLVVGMTNNLTAKKIFEENLKNALVQRSLNSVESSEVLGVAFTESKKSEEEIQQMIDQLGMEGFDAVMITAVKGIDENRAYNRGYYSYGNHYVRFGRYYYRYQDIYYNPGYYDDYKIYHVETSIYGFDVDENKSLIWVGSFDITNPQAMGTTIDDYVKKIVLQLEIEGLIKSL